MLLVSRQKQRNWGPGDSWADYDSFFVHGTAEVTNGVVFVFVFVLVFSVVNIGNKCGA